MTESESVEYAKQAFKALKGLPDADSARVLAVMLATVLGKEPDEYQRAVNIAAVAELIESTANQAAAL